MDPEPPRSQFDLSTLMLWVLVISFCVGAAVTASRPGLHIPEMFVFVGFWLFFMYLERTTRHP